MVLELGIGVTSCHEGGMGSHQDDAAVDGSSATGGESDSSCFGADAVVRPVTASMARSAPTHSEESAEF